MFARISSRLRATTTVVLLVIVLSSGLVITHTAPHVADARPAGQIRTGDDLVTALQRGGYVIILRHAATDMTQQDRDTSPDLSNCELQRNLTDAGRDQARAIGEVFRTLVLPVGQVLSSDFCRTLETARLAFGRAEPVAALRDFDPFNAPESLLKERGEAVRSLLAAPPAPGTNTIIVTHRPNITAGTGYSPDEGEAAVYRPDGAGSFTLVARLRAADWTALAPTFIGK